MYIAFRWLFGLSAAMWVAICCMDQLGKKNSEINNIIDHHKSKEEMHKNLTKLRTVPQIKYFSYQQKSTSVHYLMFFAGALAVSLYHKKNDIIVFTKKNFSKIQVPQIQQHIKKLLKTLRATAITFSVVTVKNITEWAKFTFEYIVETLERLKMKKCEPKPNSLLIQRLQEVENERETLAKLMKAIEKENKSIKIQYEQENQAKERLAKTLQQTQIFIRDNRSRFTNICHQYLVAHQENIFLKTLVRKITAEKDDAEKNLTRLICEIYNSKNSQLQTYCTHFIVSSKKSLLHSNARAEIQKFISKSQEKESLPVLQDAESNTESLALAVKSAQTWTKFEPIRVTESQSNDYTIISLKSKAPTEPMTRKLRDEYVWTVKDNQGIIEKLYEYDSHSDLDNGDTIKRIREYSVYHNKDCFLDCRNSNRYFGQDTNTLKLPSVYEDGAVLNRRKFLTGSEAFQTFLRRNRNSVVRVKSVLSDNQMQNL